MTFRKKSSQKKKLWLRKKLPYGKKPFDPFECQAQGPITVLLSRVLNGRIQEFGGGIEEQSRAEALGEFEQSIQEGLAPPAAVSFAAAFFWLRAARLPEEAHRYSGRQC
jgi:hypothetical protein